MVDEVLNCWLIEVNSAPDMAYSTAVTKRLVKLVSEDLIKVVVDHHYASPGEKRHVDTGLYECIHRGKKAERAMTFNLDLSLYGKRLTKS